MARFEPTKTKPPPAKWAISAVLFCEIKVPIITKRLSINNILFKITPNR